MEINIFQVPCGTRYTEIGHHHPFMGVPGGSGGPFVDTTRAIGQR